MLDLCEVSCVFVSLSSRKMFFHILAQDIQKLLQHLYFYLV